MNGFSRRILGAVERDPAFNAMFADHKVIPNTWGNVASQLVEQGFVEPTSEAVCDFLGITNEDLRKAEVVITQDHHVRAIERRLTDHWRGEYRELHAGDQHPYLDYLIQSFDAYKVEDSEAKADALYDAASTLNEQTRAIQTEAYDSGKPRDEVRELTRDIGRQYDVVRQRAGVYASGTVLPLDKFVEIVVGYQPNESFGAGEIMQVLRRMIDKNLLSGFPQVPNETVADVIVGRHEIDDFIDELEHRLYCRPRDYAQDKWEAIRPIFRAQDYRDHPLFAGTEK